jgi:RNA polymerase sigma factor (sigma-70 family)
VGVAGVCAGPELDRLAAERGEGASGRCDRRGARRRKRVRHGGGGRTIELDSGLAPADMSEFEILALHEAIEKLATLDERQAKVVELRFFGGMSVEEVADALGVSKRTVEGDWRHAKAWLRAEFTREATE